MILSNKTVRNIYKIVRFNDRNRNKPSMKKTRNYGGEMFEFVDQEFK